MDPRKTEHLARFLHYALGLRPDEFGLVPDAEGFFPLTEALQVAHEEGWTRIRPNHLDTLNTLLGRPVLEIHGHLVRAADRSRLAAVRLITTGPKLLYVPIRRRAYAVAARHGLRPQGHTGQVVLFANCELALKAGQRRDAEPVIVTVNVESAQARGCVLRQFGDGIFLADHLPPDCCRLPRAPKTRTRRDADPPAAPAVPKTPGSFFPDIAPLAEGASRGKSQQRPKDWKRERRKARRWKQGGDASG